MTNEPETEAFELSDAQISAMLAVGSPREPIGGWEPPSIEELQPGLPQLELIELIARGGMGAVYQGVQKSLNRRVAIKVLPPDVAKDPAFAERFKQEARSMAQLSHPGIVGIFDAGQTDGGLLYIVMEFVEGTDVGQLIEQKGRLDPQQALQITVAVCEALAFAHASGIIHRDIKPSNIMLDRNHRVKIADFGLARMTESEGMVQRTRSRLAIGTPDFVAPEALTAGGSLDQRADLYAVGVTLYQMLTGQIPRGRFENPSSMVPAVDERVDAIVDRAMKSDRDQRYATATQLRTEVLAVLDASASLRAAPPKSALPWFAWTGAAVGGVAVLSWGVSRLGVGDAPPPKPAVAAAAVTAVSEDDDDAPALPDEELQELLHATPLPPPEVVCDLPRGRWSGLCATEDEFPGLSQGPDGWQRLPKSKTFIPKKAEGVNWGVRATFRHQTNERVPELVARNTHTANYNSYLGSHGTELVLLRYDANEPIATRYRPLGKLKLRTPVPKGQPYTLELYAVGRTLVARLGDEAIRHVLPKVGDLGRFGIYGSDVDDFRDVQFLNLDGLNASDAFQLAKLVNVPVTAAVGPTDAGLKRSFTIGKWAPLVLSPNEVPSLTIADDGWLRAQQVKMLQPSAATGSNWGIRATFRGQQDDRMPELLLRESSDANYNCYLLGGKTLTIQHYDAAAATKYQTLVAEALPRPVPEGEAYTLEFFAIGEHLIARVAGHQVRLHVPGPVKVGHAAVYGPGFDDFRDVQLLKLDGLDEASALKLIGL